MDKKGLLEFCVHPFIKKIFNTFEKNNIEIKIVGGLVRDCFLNCLDDKKSYDVDFAINLPVEDVFKILQKNNFQVNTIAKNYGTLTVYDHEPSLSAEITSLRHDFNQDGRASDVQYINSWEEDAKRRDFTINAIYFHPSQGIYDPFNGVHDIKVQNIRFIGDVEKRIQEDYLRIIRFFRFLAYFEKPSFNTSLYTILPSYFEKLKNLSNERITQELFKISKVRYPQNSFLEMCKTNLWKSLGAEQNVPGERFLFPYNLQPSFALILSLINDDQFLKNALALPKKTIKESLLFKKYESIEEAYYYKGKQWCVEYAWYKSCVHGYDFEALKNQIETLSEKHPNPIFPLNGNDFMEKFNISGLHVGEVLGDTKKWWIKNQFSGAKRDCLLYASNLLQKLMH